MTTGWPWIPKLPHKCPVCDGRGTVSAGFYSPGGYAWTTSPEKCRACDGTGVIIT